MATDRTQPTERPDVGVVAQAIEVIGEAIPWAHQRLECKVGGLGRR